MRSGNKETEGFDVRLSDESGKINPNFWIAHNRRDIFLRLFDAWEVDPKEGDAAIAELTPAIPGRYSFKLTTAWQVQRQAVATFREKLKKTATHTREPKSFNGAMFRTAQETMAAAGHSVQVSDLYAMKFDPVSDRRNFTTVKNADYFKQQIEEMHATEVRGFAPDIEAELRKAESCDLMIWQFPLWWFGLPAILKGWVDRVFAMGRTYGGDRFYENGVFKGKRALLSVTTGGPAEAYQPGGFNGTSMPSFVPSIAGCCGSPDGMCWLPPLFMGQCI